LRAQPIPEGRKLGVSLTLRLLTRPDFAGSTLARLHR
jgi:hypothetical protein